MKHTISIDTILNTGLFTVISDAEALNLYKCYILKFKDPSADKFVLEFFEFFQSTRSIDIFELSKVRTGSLQSAFSINGKIWFSTKLSSTKLSPDELLERLPKSVAKQLAFNLDIFNGK